MADAEGLCEVCGRALSDRHGRCQHCAHQTTDDHTPFPHITGYQILGILGEGGMGAVYLAEEKALGRKVAVKVVSDRFVRSSGAAARFLREARAMANVEHPNIVRVYALGEEDGKTYFAMEYVEGELLAERIQRLGRLSLSESLEILKQVVEALKAAWDKKIVHRDIKPSNILLDRESRVHVADFGLAKPIDLKEDSTLTGEGAILGTPHYVSPEQALGHGLDFRSDVYSLGIVFYEMLTGEKPFRGTTPFSIVNKQVNDPLPSLRERRPDLPENVCALAEWMSQKSPQKRPPSYDALQHTIDFLIKSGGASPADISGAATMSQAVARRILLPRVVVIGAALAMLSVAWFAWTHFFRASSDTASGPAVESGLVVAVAPFYGPDEDSAKEGRVMAALVEKAILDRLGKDARVIGIDQTRMPVHDPESARSLGERWGSAFVVWGEAFALRKETEIQPYITVVPRKSLAGTVTWQSSSTGEDPLEGLAQRSVASLFMGTEIPNQIELRKMSAAGIGEMVQLMAGTYSLYVDDDAPKALSIFEHLSRSADSLHYRARALLRLARKEEALQLLHEAVREDPQHGESFALLGDLYVESGDLPMADASYRAALQNRKTYQSSLGFFHQGRLYVKETFQSKKYTGNQRLETAYLLALDPETGKILGRFHLPGAARSFLVGKDAVRVYYDAGAGQANQIDFSPGKEDRVLFYGEDLPLRIQSMQSGWALAANFMNDLESHEYAENARFESQPGILYDDAPKTLPDLETALRNAIEKDETQPWHLFLLGQVLWSQNRKDEAESTWNAIAGGTFPAIPYYDFAYMSGIFERFGQKEWADHAYRLALECRRRSPVPVGFSTLIERLVNANFIRAAAWASREGVDLERQHLWFMRARELSGVCLEGDDFAAAAWSKYYRKKHDPGKASLEDSVFAKAQRHPLNIITATTNLDYAFYVLTATAVSFPVLAVLILLRALKKSESAFKHASSSVQGLKPALIVLAGLVLGIILWKQHWEQLMLFAALLLTALILLRSANVTPSSVVASIPLNGRIALVAGFCVFLAALSVCIFLNHRVYALLNRPLQVADSPDGGGRSPDELLAEKYEWKVWLTRIWVPGRNLYVFSSDVDADSETSEDFVTFFHQVTLVLIMGLFLAFLWKKPLPRDGPGVPEHPASGRLSTIVYYLIPGSFDMRCRSFSRGYWTLALFAFALFSILGEVLLPHRFPVPGIVTLLQMPNYFNSVPFPTPPLLDDIDSIVGYHYWTIFFAYSHATVFWLSVALAGLVSLTLHVLRFPAMRS